MTDTCLLSGMQARGKVLFEISKLNEDILYFAGAGKGIGSVELGVDRGASYASTVIYFDRVGPKDQCRPAKSEIPGFARERSLEAGHGGVFCRQHSCGITDRIGRERQDYGRCFAAVAAGHGQHRGSSSDARIRATINWTRCAVRSICPRRKRSRRIRRSKLRSHMLPTIPGRIVNSVAPDGRALTIRLHHSFLQPPDDGYKPRIGDPRIGAFGIELQRLLRAFRQRNRYPLGASISLGKERSDSQGQRAEAAARVLPGCRHSGTDSQLYARRNSMVEHGLRGCWLSQRDGRERPDPGHGSDGHPLQLRVLGESR